MKFTEKYRCWSVSNVIINGGVLSLINVITSHLAPRTSTSSQLSNMEISSQTGGSATTDKDGISQSVCQAAET